MAFSFLSRFRIRADNEADNEHIVYLPYQPLIERMIARLDGSYSRELLVDLEPSTEG